jgi:hypothetical protein
MVLFNFLIRPTVAKRWMWNRVSKSGEGKYIWKSRNRKRTRGAPVPMIARGMQPGEDHARLGCDEARVATTMETVVMMEGAEMTTDVLDLPRLPVIIVPAMITAQQEGVVHRVAM